MSHPAKLGLFESVCLAAIIRIVPSLPNEEPEYPMSPPADPTASLLEAASFAARAHRHQLRKDGQTPYAAHPFRVCLVVRHVFGIDDPRVLTAALLHDTIEDTPTDFDDLADRFGADVAGWVAALTKDMRLEEAPREEAYRRVLAGSPWPVVLCMLGDIYDNLTDSRHLPPDRRQRSVRRSEEYLAVLQPNLPPEARSAFELVERQLAQVRGA
jgi:guanosine-3',5'-bis(diphosphate) 3'-pyrophosphohydrolase